MSHQIKGVGVGGPCGSIRDAKHNMSL